MAKISDLISGRSTLSSPQIEWLEKLIGDWQLLADLSFSDLILWVPLRKDLKSWPTGHIAVAHIRPTTAATLFQQDLIGDELEWGRKPLIDRALSDGEIIKDSEPEQFGEFFKNLFGHKMSTIGQLKLICQYFGVVKLMKNCHIFLFIWYSIIM